KKLVLPDWTANLRTHNISIKSGLAQGTLTRGGLIAGIQLAVLKIFVGDAVGFVRSSQQDGIELPAGRMSELGAELILQNRELLDGVDGDIDVGTGHVLQVVVGALN